MPLYSSSDLWTDEQAVNKSQTRFTIPTAVDIKCCLFSELLHTVASMMFKEHRCVQSVCGVRTCVSWQECCDELLISREENVFYSIFYHHVHDPTASSIFLLSFTMSPECFRTLAECFFLITFAAVQHPRVSSLVLLKQLQSCVSVFTFRVFMQSICFFLLLDHHSPTLFLLSQLILFLVAITKTFFLLFLYLHKILTGSTF